MKLIADIGTNPDLIKIDVADVLLHHFLKYYDKIGVTEFILHGNNEVIDEIKPIYESNYNVKFVTITKEQYYESKERSYRKYEELEAQNKLSLYNQQPCVASVCPLWIIQNDLKKQYIAEDELCFILDLDEFVEITSTELKAIQESDIQYCRGVLNDRIGESGGRLICLNKHEDIFDQLDQLVDITKGVANRATNKVVITRGHLEHCHGHHDLYYKKEYHKKHLDGLLNVWHCKYFKQNVQCGLGSHGKAEQDYFKS